MKLIELRKGKKLSQEYVAKVIGVSQSNYSKYEQGKLEPDISTIIKLANFYDVGLDFLCERPYNNNLGYISDEIKAIVKDLSKLDPLQLSYVKGAVEIAKMNNKKQC